MDIGWSELLVVGVVALIVIGPKDLPEMFRTLGRFTAKMRAMARDFSRAMEDAAKETGVNDIAGDLRKVASPKSMGLEAVKSAADKFEKWDPLKGGRPGATPVAAAAPLASTAAPAAAGALDLPPAVPDPAAAPPAVAKPAPGPATAALAEKVSLRKGIAAEAAEKLRATRIAEGAVAPEAAPKPGRTRSSTPKPTVAKAAVAKAAPAAELAAKPARKAPVEKAAAEKPATKPTTRKTAAAKSAAKDAE